MLEKGKQREEEKELEMDKREDTEKGTPIFSVSCGRGTMQDHGHQQKGRARSSNESR